MTSDWITQAFENFQKEMQKAKDDVLLLGVGYLKLDKDGLHHIKPENIAIRDESDLTE